MNRPILKYQAL